MKSALWFALLLGSPAFSQTTPDTAAADSLAKRMQSLKLLNNRPRKVLAPGPIAESHACSIPLLSAGRSSGFISKMPVKKPVVIPESAAREIRLKMPAPPCDPNLFQNK